MLNDGISSDNSMFTSIFPFFRFLHLPHKEFLLSENEKRQSNGIALI